MKFSTKNLARRETGWYLTVVQMVWLIAQRRQDSFPTHAVIGRGDQPNIGPWVYDGLIQRHSSMKRHCMGGADMPYLLGMLALILHLSLKEEVPCRGIGCTCTIIGVSQKLNSVGLEY